MVEAPVRRRSPLSHRRAIEAEAGAVHIAERPFLGKFILRADPALAAERLGAALGLGLPIEPLTSSVSGGTALLWMGPDEWMLVTAPDAAAACPEAVRDALAGTHHQLVDVSDYYTMVEIAGGKARELLAKLTTIDLHPRAFRSGMVTGGIFGRANAAIWQNAEDAAPGGPAFRLFIRWSMADYFWCLMAAAGREWGVPEQLPVKGETLVAV